MPNQRKTIAVLIDHLDSIRHDDGRLRTAFSLACRRFDLDLLWVVGGRSPEPFAWGARRNSLCELVAAGAIDGVIITPGSIAASSHLDQLEAMCAGCPTLPLCSAGLSIPGVPSVVIDGAAACSALLEHVIAEHGRRQIAFISHPEGALGLGLRFEACREVLARHALSTDPRCEARGAPTIEGGRRAMAELVSRGVAFDAVVASSDIMAVGAAELLFRQGDLGRPGPSLLGYGDLALGRLGTPGLSTVREPLERLASLAVGRVLDQMRGRPVAALTSLPAEVVLRQSCGCRPHRTPAQSSRAPALQRAWAEAAHERAHVSPLLRYSQLVSSGEHLSYAADLDDVKRRMSHVLPNLNVTEAVIALYDEGDPERTSPLLYLRGGVACEAAADDALRSLARAGAPEEAQLSSYLLPLIAGGRHIGVALFRLEEEDLDHLELLCGQISQAIHAAQLKRQVARGAALHERAREERRIATEHMESLRVLAGGVAHDLNNALGPLLALPSVIAQELADEEHAPFLDRGRLRADLMTIHSAALRASQTIKDLLTLGRQGRTAQHAVDLNQAISSWQTTSDVPEATEGGVSVQVDLDQQPLVIKASEAHLLRALTNLVRNAMEAAEPSGVVRIETRRVELPRPHHGHERIEPGQYALLCVSDTGRGIPREVLARLFEPFVTTKRVSGSSGSGLGLAVVHGVVKEHGGFIDVRTEPGRGSAFSLYFPLTAEAPRRVAPLSAPPHGNGRLLVVDDDPIQLTTTRRVLSHLGYDVTTLSSGREAYEALAAAGRSGLGAGSGVRSSPFDVVLMDLALNEAADGLELIERLLMLYPDQRAIIASGHAPDERARRAIERGLVWLTKPYTVNALARALTKLLGADAPEPMTDPLVPVHSFTAMLRPSPAGLPGSSAAARSGKRR